MNARTCPHCGLALRPRDVVLGPEGAEALLLAQPREASTCELARIAGTSRQLMHFHLLTLQRRGLARSRKEGRNRLWRATPKETSDARS